MHLHRLINYKAFVWNPQNFWFSECGFDSVPPVVLCGLHSRPAGIVRLSKPLKWNEIRVCFNIISDALRFSVSICLRQNSEFQQLLIKRGVVLLLQKLFNFFYALLWIVQIGICLCNFTFRYYHIYSRNTLHIFLPK